MSSMDVLELMFVGVMIESEVRDFDQLSAYTTALFLGIVQKYALFDLNEVPIEDLRNIFVEFQEQFSDHLGEQKAEN